MKLKKAVPVISILICASLAASHVRAQAPSSGCDADKQAFAQEIGVPCSGVGEALDGPTSDKPRTNPINPTPATIAPSPTNPKQSLSSILENVHPDVGPFAPPPRMALVYIYRYSTRLNIAPADFLLDDTRIVGLWNKEYTWFYVPEGDHKVDQIWGGIALIGTFGKPRQWLSGILHWDAGRTYYYEFKQDLAGIQLSYATYRTSLTSERAFEARETMEFLKYRPSKKTDPIPAEGGPLSR